LTFHKRSLIIASSGHISKVKDTSLSLINPELNYRSKLGKNGFLPSTNSLKISGESDEEYFTL
jgi:hypothetical protein